jgi:hypothetical protein
MINTKVLGRTSRLLSLYTTVTAQKVDANWEEGLDIAWLVDGDKQMT